MRDHMMLSGRWGFALDPRDVGVAERWWARDDMFRSAITVPGAWQAQGFGDNRHQTQPCQTTGFPPGGVQSERTSYLGTGWYRRALVVPAAWRGKRVRLRLCGVHPKAEVWLDGIRLGEHGASALEWTLEITGRVRFGATQWLTVRVSESELVANPGPGSPRQRGWSNPLSNGTCNLLTWSGLYRDVLLEAVPSARIERVRIVPDVARGAASVRLAVVAPAADDRAGLVARCRVRDGRGCTAGTAVAPLRWRANRGAATVTIPIRHPRLWSPESPTLYRLDVVLEARGQPVDAVRERFGLREFRVAGTHILLNGHPVFLRGYGDDQLWAYTLAPDLERRRLEKDIRQARDYGFNLVNFLYSMPHQEFLDVADECGLLVQCYPIFSDGHAELEARYLPALLAQYENHPSVMIYSVAAEVYHHEPDMLATLRRRVRLLRRLDPTRLVIATGGIYRLNTRRDDTDVYEINVSWALDELQAPPPWDKPVVLHEFAWWSSYPNPALKPKYARSALRPFHIEHAERVAGQRGLTPLLPRFVKNSEALQALERKTGVETARRTVNGYALWLGKDGMAATEGLWDDFGDPKNVSAAEFRQSNGEIVVLIDRAYHDRCYWSGETIPVAITVSNQSARPLRGAAVTWSLVAGGRTVLARGRVPIGKIEAYADRTVQGVLIRPKPAPAAVRVDLRMALQSGGAVPARNQWPFWLFPQDFMAVLPRRLRTTGIGLPVHYRAAPAAPAEADVWITNRLDAEVLAFLTTGGRVFYVQTRAGLPQCDDARFRSIAWNAAAHGSSGTIIAPHPALADFPHDGYCGLPFYALLQYAPAFVLDDWAPAIRPIIRSIDSYKSGRTQAYLFEAAVGRGALLATTLNLFYLNQRAYASRPAEVAGPFLLDRLLRTVCADSWAPAGAIAPASLAAQAGLPVPITVGRDNGGGTRRSRPARHARNG